MPKTDDDSKTTDTTDAPKDEPTGTGGDQTADTTDWKAEAEKWKAMSRKNEEQAKANAEKAKKFDEAEEANKTELERERSAREKAEKALADRDAKDEAAKLRKEVAKEKGLPESALRGSSRDELEDHADELIAAGLKAKPAPTTDGQGDVGEQVSETDEKSVDEIVNAVVGK